MIAKSGPDRRPPVTPLSGHAMVADVRQLSRPGDIAFEVSTVQQSSSSPDANRRFDAVLQFLVGRVGLVSIFFRALSASRRTSSGFNENVAA